MILPRSSARIAGTISVSSAALEGRITRLDRWKAGSATAKGAATTAGLGAATGAATAAGLGAETGVATAEVRCSAGGVATAANRCATVGAATASGSTVDAVSRATAGCVIRKLVGRVGAWLTGAGTEAPDAGAALGATRSGSTGIATDDCALGRARRRGVPASSVPPCAARASRRDVDALVDDGSVGWASVGTANGAGAAARVEGAACCVGVTDEASAARAARRPVGAADGATGRAVGVTCVGCATRGRAGAATAGSSVGRETYRVTWTGGVWTPRTAGVESGPAALATTLRGATAGVGPLRTETGECGSDRVDPDCTSDVGSVVRSASRRRRRVTG